RRDGAPPDRGRAPAGRGLAAQRRRSARDGARVEDRRRVARRLGAPEPRRRPLPRRARGRGSRGGERGGHGFRGALMRGTSGESLAQARDRFEPVLRSAGEGALALGEQLFAVTAAFDGSAPLRRSLADPSRSGADKADLVAGLVRSRWTRETDLADATERLGLDAVLASAEARGALEKVEDELFRTSRALVGQREARQLLSDETTDPDRRAAFLKALLGG